jgi:hypothetical protein
MNSVRLYSCCTAVGLYTVVHSTAAATTTILVLLYRATVRHTMHIFYMRSIEVEIEEIG